MAGPALANRGRLTGSLLFVLGAWGALIPFVGPYIGYAYTPDKAWAYTSGRLWLSAVPGAAAALGGLLVAATDRAAAPGAFLAAVGGAWFVVGQPVTAFALASKHISPGTPVTHNAIFSTATMRFMEDLGFFYGLGVLILFVASIALGELVVARMAARRFSQWSSGSVERTDEFGPAY
jgi:hypothetical protein